MSDATRAVVRYLGGETGHRSFFGGTRSRPRVLLLAFFIAAGIVLTPLIGWPGLLVGVIGCVITLAVTAKTHRGSIVDRRRMRARWRGRVRAGTVEFAPYSDEAWREAETQLKTARATHRRGRQAAVARARARIASLRVHPDGADGMGWLQHGRGQPGIAWHAPAGEDDYLSVVFSVSGQLHGIESTAVMTRAAEGWGHFLAARAPHSSLVGNVQTLTRVLPADSAWNKGAWIKMRNPLPKRFYERAEVLDKDGLYHVALDGRTARTPARNPLAVTSRAVAEALAQEWDAQAGSIDPARMPINRLVN